jgi:hypothetical protein
MDLRLQYWQEYRQKYRQACLQLTDHEAAKTLCGVNDGTDEMIDSASSVPFVKRCLLAGRARIVTGKGSEVKGSQGLIKFKGRR